ncbi:glomulin-like isoform X1 [Montipora capricornis]|uniref:glomulin-like isoform X1 n=1 Tax=Montipora capricornis TaxID=246305 RepID=UPI0035F16763
MIRVPHMLAYTKDFIDKTKMADDAEEELQKSLSNFCKDEPSSHLILVASKKCIDNGKWRELVDSLAHPDYEDALLFVGWELIGIICQAFDDDTQLTVDRIQECNRILKVIAERCSAKEVCIGVLEQLDSEPLIHLEKFSVLLNTLKTAINKLKEKKFKIVSMVLPCIVQHIASVQLPQELIASKSDKDEERTSLVMKSVLEHLQDFLRPLLQEVSIQTSSLKKSSLDSYITSVQQEILQCLIQLLNYPLVFLDLAKDAVEMFDCDDREDSQNLHTMEKLITLVSPFRMFACEIMEFIQMIGDSYVSVYLMEYGWKTGRTCGDEIVPSNWSLTAEEKEKIFPLLGLSCFMYLLLVERVEKENFPTVFSFKYMLRVNMKYVLCLLSRTELYVIYKGLELLDSLSTKLEDNCLEYRHDEFRLIVDISKALINVMTMCSSKKLRIRGAHVFPNLLVKLDTRSQYGIMFMILEDCSHSGVAGLVTYLLKEQVNRALCSTVEEPWFQGTRLMSILQLVLKPPPEAGTEKDLVQETDRIMGALNVLRFILLRDLSDKTRVWENFTALEKNFLEPLRGTLRETRLQYQAEVLRKQDEIAENKSKGKDENIEFNIKSPDGQSLPSTPLTAQVEALQSGLYSLDIIESVLVRISEIANSRKKEGK